MLPTHREACGCLPSSQASDPHLGLLSWVPAGEGAMTALPSPPTNTDPTAVLGPGDMAKNQAGPQDPQLQFWETDTAGKEADQSRSRLQTVAVARRKMRAEGLDAPSGSLPKPPGPLGPLLCGSWRSVPTPAMASPSPGLPPRNLELLYLPARCPAWLDLPH